MRETPSTPGDFPQRDPRRKALLDRHLLALREQIAAVARQKELEGDLLAAARPEFERRCERDGQCHRSVLISASPPVTLECEVLRHGVPLDSPAYATLPEWLVAEGCAVDRLAVREEFARGAGARETAAAIPEEVLERFFAVRREYQVPDAILSHPDCSDGAVQQHVAWLVAEGLVQVPSELMEIQVRPEFMLEPGLGELRSAVDADVLGRYCETCRVWLAPPEIGHYKYSRDARQWAGYRSLEQAGAVSVQYAIRFSA